VPPAGSSGGVMRLHPADLRLLAELLGQQMTRAIGASGAAAAQTSNLYVRGA